VEVLAGLFLLALAGIVADTVTKVVKSRSGAPIIRAQLEELTQQVQDQAALLADANAMIASQAESIQELHERVDFAERILTQVRERGTLGRGSEEVR
jgi:hypothetical protein